MDPTRVCQICGDHAKPTEKFYTHYGAICCLGCKAFFRRIHQDGKDVGKLKCRLNNNCDLTGIKRTKCQKCRYNKCLHVGLRSEFVLNEEDRKKYTHPKKNKRPRLDEDQPSSSSNSNFNSTVHNNSSEESPERSRSASPKNTMAFVMNQILTDYAIATVETSLDENVAKVIISGHLSSIWTKEHTEAFFVAVQHVMRFFANFAQKNTYFMSLCPEDQGTLLTNNSKLYAQYVMSRYFGATNGLDQLTWLLGPNMPLLSTAAAVKESLRCITFDMVNQDGLVIPLSEQTAINWVKDGIDVINANFNLPPFRNGLMAAYLIFSTDFIDYHHERLLEEARIAYMYETLSKIIQHESSHVSELDRHLPQLVEILINMAKITSDHFGLHGIDYKLNSLALEFEDKLRVDNCVRTYDKCFSQPVLGEVFIEDFKKMSLMDHSAKAHLQETGYMLHKFRLSLWIDEIMPNLSPEEKMLCLTKSTYLTTSLLYVVLMERKNSSFAKQLKFIMGVGDDTSIPGIDSLPPLQQEVFYGVVPVVRKHDLHRKLELRKKLGQFLKSHEILAMAIFMILASNSDNPSARHAYDTYKRLFIRILKDDPEFEDTDPEELLKSFFQDNQSYTSLKTKIIFECCGKSHVMQ